MLTILFLIHLWLYPTPRKSQSCFTSTSAKKTNTNCNSGESASTRHSEYAPGPSKSESVKVLKEASCKSNFYTEVAVVAVCRISTSATVEVPEQDLESCDCHFKMSMEDKFRAAVRVIHSLPKDGKSTVKHSVLEFGLISWNLLRDIQFIILWFQGRINLQTLLN